MSKPAFNGVAIRCTGQDVPKFRGRYVSIIVKVTQDGFNSENNSVSAHCALDGTAVTINDFTGRDNITAVLEVVCFVDNISGGLVYQHHSSVDDEIDVKGFTSLIAAMQKHSAVFGF